MAKAAKPVKASKATKVVKPASTTIAKQEVVATSKGAQSGIVQEYNELVGQGSITAKSGEESILVLFPGVALMPGDEVQFDVEERKNRRNLMGQEFGPGKLAVNVKLVKAVPRQPVYRRPRLY